MTDDRIILLVTSPRLPVGLLSADAWDAVRRHPVLVAAEGDWSTALRMAGSTVTAAPATADALLDAVAEHGTVVWWAGPTGDERLARELGLRLARAPGTAELELMYGSWDPPGARLLDAVTVLDQLVSPGGDPWLREVVAARGEGPRTHRALAHFLLEECYEAHDAIDADDPAALREELGDLLMQVALHARLAEDLADEERWSIDDVAGDLVAKLIRRNPHVFAGAEVSGVDDIIATWERVKQSEKARGSALDGIALSQPALALAAKVLARVGRLGPLVPLPAGADAGPGHPDEAALGAALLGLVAVAADRGQDAEGSLRRAVLGYADAVRAAEAASPAP